MRLFLLDSQPRQGQKVNTTLSRKVNVSKRFKQDEGKFPMKLQFRLDPFMINILFK